jgi:hypothetical protein
MIHFHVGAYPEQFAAVSHPLDRSSILGRNIVAKNHYMRLEQEL